MNSKIIKSNESLSCGCCGQSRRAFLGNCAKCIGAAGVFSGFALPTILATEGCTSQSRMKVRVVFVLHAPIQPKPDWPNVGFDFYPVMEKIMNTLANGCRGIEFVQSMVADETQADRLIVSDNANGNIEGYIVVQMNCWDFRSALDRLFGGTQNKPVLYANFLYGGCGGFLPRNAKLLRSNMENIAFISSGNFGHLAAAANCMRLAKGQGGNKAFADAVKKLRMDIVAGVNIDMTCANDHFDILSTDELLKELKTKKMLEFESGWADVIPETKDSLGIEIIRRPFTELNGLWEKADRDQAMGIVKRWKDNATAIVSVPDETLEKSARMYIAMKQCLTNHDACAITVNCLGGFYGNHIQAYPCLGFHELLNEGLIGACECDTLSTLTMVVMTTLTKGRPGYISDPVMDVATKQIIYAHCVASNKPFGPQEASNPFTILTHSEDRHGASLRSILPVGYMTTTLEMDPQKKEILFHQAKSVGNSDEDRACRTKIACVPVGDFEKLFTEWDRWGWHRVTYYGDLKKPVFALADALGWKIVEEA